MTEPLQAPSTTVAALPISYTIKGAAQATGLSVRRLYRFIKDGRLKPSKFDRRTILYAEDLHELIRSHRVAKSPTPSPNPRARNKTASGQRTPAPTPRPSARKRRKGAAESRVTA